MTTTRPAVSIDELAYDAVEAVDRIVADHYRVTSELALRIRALESALSDARDSALPLALCHTIDMLLGTVQKEDGP